MIFEVITIVLILSFLVIIHELGHFVAAKLAKINVEEFGLGYPPRAATLFKKWGTVFSLNWIPFGGFVKMEGEDPGDVVLAEKKAPPKSPKTEASEVGPFYQKSAFARLCVILAGATVNFIFGVIAFGIVFSFLGIPVNPRVGQVAQNSPAAEAGLPTNVQIIAIQVDNQFIEVTDTKQVIDLINQQRGQSVTLKISGQCSGFSCQGESRDISIYARTLEETPENQGAIGIVIDSVVFLPWYEMFIRGMIYGLIQALMFGIFLLQALGDMLVNLVVHGVVPQEVAGPVGIVVETNRRGLLDGGWLAALNFAGMLSVNLAIMNVLPIPALDGGRAVFIILEKIFGKKRISKIESYAHYGGYVVLLGLIILVTVKDVYTIFVN